MPRSRPQPEWLYHGHDLANAAEQSRVRRSVADAMTGLSNGVAILGGLTARRLSPGTAAPCQLVTATGKIIGADATLTAVYAGTGANRAWCLSAVFDQYDETVAGTARAAGALHAQFEKLAAGANFIVGDGINAETIASIGHPFLTLPAWIKQRLRVQADWATQLKLLRRGTRQEVARILRKQGYESRLTTDSADLEHFYAGLYQPYAMHRFRKGAVLVERERFMAECRRGVVLQLTLRGSLIGASLLRRIGNTLAIVWSALDPQADSRDLRGATDALDYFSLLYAQLKGCHWLDFGPSRPDLFDGALRYKRKWGTEVTTGYVPQPGILFACTGRHDAERDVLRRHALVCRRGHELTAVAFVDGDAALDALLSTVASIVIAGIDRYRIVTLTALPADARAAIEGIDPRVSVIEAASAGEAMASVNR